MGPRDPPILTPRPIYPHYRVGGTDPLGAFAPHPNGQKGSKQAQKGPKWLKMTKNGPKRGSVNLGVKSSARPKLAVLEGTKGAWTPF